MFQFTDNVLFGCDGDDLLAGQSGRDLFIGGLGANRIVGNSDDDVLIAGYTAFDYDANRRLTASHDQSLFDVMAEWTSDRDYEIRIANLTDESGSTNRKNGTTFLKISGENATIFEDDDKDVLTGAAGFDWFYFDTLRNRATDLKDEVFANDLDFLLS